MIKQLTLSFALVIISAIIGVGWVISGIYENTDQKNEMDAELSSYHQFAKSLALSLEKLPQSKASSDYWQNQSPYKIDLKKYNEFPIPKDLEKKFKHGEPLLLQSDKGLSLHVYMSSTQQVMTMMLPTTSHEKKHSWVNISFTLIFYGSVLMILLIWLYPLIRRLILLQKTALTFGQGQLMIRLKPSRWSYIKDIESEFNKMADRIQALIKDNKLLSQAVSHNLKTPLTRLRFGVDMLEETLPSNLKNNFKSNYIERFNNDIDEMELLIDALLQYAKLDEPSIALKKETIDLNGFILELFDNLENSKVTIGYIFSSETIRLNTDSQYLSMQLNNIISNAINHAQERVIIKTGKNNNGQVYIKIEDDGKGIPIEERDKITQPFYQSINSKSLKGHGMGLAIVSRISTWLKVNLNISHSKNLGGASIELTFEKNT